MKALLRTLLILSLIAAFVIFISKNWTTTLSPSSKATFDNPKLNVTVKYARPYMKKRKIFGELVPYAKVWRTGANEATIIEFSKNVTIMGKALAAGTYTLWSIPSPKKWNIIFNKEVGQWGTNYDEDKNILTVEVLPQSLSDSIEQFTISFTPTKEGCKMNLLWENTQVSVPIK